MGCCLRRESRPFCSNPSGRPKPTERVSYSCSSAVLIDATDGTLARAVRIKEAVPGFDGRRLDDLVDFLLYTCLPLLLIDRAGLLPEGCRWVLVAALVASAYGFCQADVKTEDGAFLGFPSYWNVVAFYLFGLPVTGEWAVGLILGLAVLTFVPSRYAYLTQPGRSNRLMLLLSIPWALLLAAALALDWDEGLSRTIVRASALYPALYLGSAWAMSLWRFVSGDARRSVGEDGPRGDGFLGGQRPTRTRTSFPGTLSDPEESNDDPPGHGPGGGSTDKGAGGGRSVPAP